MITQEKNYQEHSVSIFINPQSLINKDILRSEIFTIINQRSEANYKLLLMILKTFYVITFGFFEFKVTKKSVEYRESNKNITHWHNLLSYIIKINDKQDKQPIPISVADELTKRNLNSLVLNVRFKHKS